MPKRNESEDEARSESEAEQDIREDIELTDEEANTSGGGTPGVIKWGDNTLKKGISDNTL